MRRYLLLLPCCLLFLLAGNSGGEVVQHFDAAGNLVPETIKKAPSSAHKTEKYSVAQSLGLRPDVRYEFYPVFGKTFAEIVKSAEENGPFDKKTKKRQTSAFAWSMGWTYQHAYTTEYDEENDKLHCDILIHDVMLSYDITITLPVLTDDSSLNDIEKDLWKNYIARLLESEHNRVKIVKDDTREGILRRMGEIIYIMLDAEQENMSDKLIERYVKEETARIGKETIMQIQAKLNLVEQKNGAGSTSGPGELREKKRKQP
jgi:predicted secreted Zn-dependent protease